MKIVSKCILLLTLITTAPTLISGQEVILPLGTNPQLNKQISKTFKKAADDVLLELPIVDDFYYNSPYPDPAIWSDNFAYINNGFAIDPPSLGVATLDALDANGAVYTFATISPETFNADYLTSNPINLNYPASDSIYLSFFYQPQGNGLQPKAYDSLCLDFYDVGKDVWINIWRKAGDTLHAFEQVMIPITDTLFLKEGFRFGFRNKASLPQNDDYKDKRGNVDHWNIDYVRLARNRSYKDTIIRDVAFNKPISSMLKNYEAIPWDHFELGYNTLYQPFVVLNYFNNDTATRNVTRNMEIRDEVWKELYNPANASAQDILPGTATSYNISSVFPFNFNRGDTALYSIKAWLRTDDFDNKVNDTIYRQQVFRDYFAYDDGSAERAYGLRGQGTNNGLIAVRFNSYIADVLGGVDIYFAQLKDSINLDYYFKFMVWDDIEGMPGDLIYEDNVDYSAEYTDMINTFKRFEFKNPVTVEGTFYVGILQYNQYLLNIGLDINRPAKGNLLYNLGSEWLTSAAPGSLMLRPFVKRNYSKINEFPPQLNRLNVYPNPAKNYIRLDIPENNPDITFKIYDITGKERISGKPNNKEIFTGELPDGIYIISVMTNSRLYRSEKIIIHK